MALRWFPASSDQVAHVRRAVADALVVAGCDREEIGEAILVASELAANVIDHSASESIGLDVRRAGDVARVEVIDLDPSGDPRPGPGGTESLRGRGLLIVDAISLRWGVDTTEDDRKTVWAEVRCS